MCRFCSSNSCVGNDALIDSEKSFGPLGKFTLLGQMATYEGKVYFDLSIDPLGTDSNRMRQLCEFNFCPKCGRSLKQNTEEKYDDGSTRDNYTRHQRGTRQIETRQSERRTYRSGIG